MADSVILNNQREFRCKHCNGKILIPWDLPPTTGPCPHCGEQITSAFDNLPELPVARVAADTPAADPSEKLAAAPGAAIHKPAAELPPLVNHADIIPPDKRRGAKTVKPQSSGLISAMLVLLALILLGGGVVWFAAKELGRDIEPPTVRIAAGDPAVDDANYIRIGWQKDAYQVLRGFMGAPSPQAKIPFILNGSRLATQVEDFYRDGGIGDSDTPADAFSIYELSEADRKRGLFGMIYDRPPQFDMKEFFRPLASLEVLYGLDEADLLLGTLARGGNFTKEPLRVLAFFKRTPAGLKLDWEIFVQTKYRTLRDFVERPEVGQSGLFRVLIVEDVPDKGRAVAGNRTYRLADPVNTGDRARINVKVDSAAGRALSVINWGGTKGNRPLTLTATVELKWSGPSTAGELEISRLVCWEFLGLGGQETPATDTTQ